MPGKHIYDPSFVYSSTELKQVLSRYKNIHFDYCLDMPCGDGRNIFLLATYFKKIVGVDINDMYLDEIKKMIPEYDLSTGSISTKKIDLTYEMPGDMDRFDFIATVHHYDYSLISRTIDNIKKGALYYIETPGCSGGNHKGLPGEKEVDFLFKDMEILMFKSHPCSSSALQSKSITFKALVRKNL
jgi:hypothetical protein